MRKAKSASELGFTSKDEIRLQKAMQCVGDKRTFIRLQSVWLFARGMEVFQIAEIAEKSRRIVYAWIHRYLQNHQSDSLKDADKTGRPLPVLPALRIKESSEH